MASIDTKLEQARIALHNALSSEEVLSRLSRYGYNEEQLQEGMTLYARARTLTQTQSDSRHSKVTATKSFYEIWQEVQYHYHHDLRAARLALRQHEESHYFLHLPGKRRQKFSDWQEQAKDFYYGLRDKPELQVIVASKGVTAQRIDEGVQLLQALESARLQQHSQKGNAGDMRRQRNEALQALKLWMKAFRLVARAAFLTTPAYLATLGFEPTPSKNKKNSNPEAKAKKEAANAVAAN